MSSVDAETSAAAGLTTEPQRPLLQGLIAKPGQRVPERTVRQGPPRTASLTAIPKEQAPVLAVESSGQAAATPATPSARAASPDARPSPHKPFQNYKIEDMAMVLHDPTTVCARTQMELRGMDRSPKQLQLRVSESLQAGLKAYCEDTNLQQRALVEALLRAFLAEQGRPLQD